MIQVSEQPANQPSIPRDRIIQMGHFNQLLGRFNGSISSDLNYSKGVKHCSPTLVSKSNTFASAPVWCRILDSYHVSAYY